MQEIHQLFDNGFGGVFFDASEVFENDLVF